MKIKDYIVCAIVVLILIFLSAFSNGNIGVAKSNLEKDARKSQKIPDSWLTTKCISDDLGAFIFYNEDLSKYTYSIYINRDDFSFGYFFREGGGLPGEQEYILRCNYGEKGSVVLSSNKAQINKIEIDNGIDEPEVILIDPQKPFAVVIPEISGEVRVYDVKDNLLNVKFITG